MTRHPNKKTYRPDQIKDEPGAEERFKGILKRALNTPPAKKQTAKKSKPPKEPER